jgi:hypothetical protein
MRKFSRKFTNLEERKNTRSAITFSLLTIVAIAVLYFIGIPLLGKLTAFVTSFKGNNKISSSDITPPPPPKFKYLSEYTNQLNVTISGNTEAGATVKLIFNGEDKETLADTNGQFTFNVALQSGINTFAATASDQSGNQSQKSEDRQITFDNKVPNLEITSPGDGSNYFGSAQRQITIQGTTESGSQVTINERIISVDENGSFQYTTTLNDGNNSFNIKSTDQAGNLTEKGLSLNFTP